MEPFEYIPALWREEKGKEKTEEKGKEKMDENGRMKEKGKEKMEEKGKMEGNKKGKEVKNGSGKNVMPIKVESPCPIIRNLDKIKESGSPRSPFKKLIESPKRVYKHMKEKAKQKKEEKEEEEMREEEKKQREQRERKEREQRKERILMAKVPFGEGGYGKVKREAANLVLKRKGPLLKAAE
ncbi:hypothetical protein niasHS_006198 [Heterodera schachtii]|uniref:Protein kinase domain-containing protein n=1 Tax=Heterodera schachtii TaxID=97005 RepID=A0ABD2JSI3_HETSC